jgi:lactoylglutathione lyase
MMNAATPPAAELFVTQFLVVSDQDRSRDFYQSVLGADVVRDRDPVILALANTRIVLNVGGGPTDDKPTVRLAPPADPDVSSGFLNLRVRDIAKAYRDWSARAPRSSPSQRTTGTKSAPTSAIRTVISSR